MVKKRPMERLKISFKKRISIVKLICKKIGGENYEKRNQY